MPTKAAVLRLSAFCDRNAEALAASGVIAAIGFIVVLFGVAEGWPIVTGVSAVTGLILALTQLIRGRQAARSRLRERELPIAAVFSNAREDSRLTPTFRRRRLRIKLEFTYDFERGA